MFLHSIWSCYNIEVNILTNSNLLSRCKGALLYKEKAPYVLRSEQPGLSSACAILRRFAPHKGMHPLRRLQLSSLSKRRDEKVHRLAYFAVLRTSHELGAVFFLKRGNTDLTPKRHRKSDNALQSRTAAKAARDCNVAAKFASILSFGAYFLKLVIPRYGRRCFR